MNKNPMRYITIGFCALLLVVVVLLAYGGHRGSGGIVLAEAPSDGSGVEGSSGENHLNVVEISPKTVQPAIRTLSRPASYSRAQLVETFWSGGSGQSLSQVYVSGGSTRIDTQMADGSVRHMLIRSGEDPEDGQTPGGALVGVWYDDETEWKLLRGGPAAADLAERMLSYETVLELPPEDIAAAGYQELGGTYCIYVETAADEAGYVCRYWVSVENGLLYAAERSLDGELVYRFTAGPADSEPPEAALFLLPDGSSLEDSAPS